MQTENQTTAHAENVMQSLAKFLSDICFDGEFKNHPEYLTELFEYILETEIGNDLQLRMKILSCIRTSKMLVKTLEPFSESEIEEAFYLMR